MAEMYFAELSHAIEWAETDQKWTYCYERQPHSLTHDPDAAERAVDRIETIYERLLDADRRGETPDAYPLIFRSPKPGFGWDSIK